MNNLKHLDTIHHHIYFKTKKLKNDYINSTVMIYL